MKQNIKSTLHISEKGELVRICGLIPSEMLSIVGIECRMFGMNFIYKK